MTRAPLRVTSLQLPARWGDVEGQLARVEELLARGPETDLVLLPEASLSGYAIPARALLPSEARGAVEAPVARTVSFLEGLPEVEAMCGPEALLPGPSGPAVAVPPVEFAESLDGPTARALAGLARRHGVHLVGPLVERDGERLFNAMVGFTPSGERFLHYRKRHPWYPESWATPATAPLPRVTILGRTVTLAICFDVHFLAGESRSELEAADVLLFPSAWVDDGDTKAGLLDALSRQFRVAVVNANWAAGEVSVFGQGHSLVLGPGGAALARAELGLERLDASLS